MARPLTPRFACSGGLALTCLLLLGVAGCDQPTAPSAAAPPSPRAEWSTDAVPLVRPVLHDSRTRYRDAGHRPARGRSGTAALSMLALLGRDGTTEVRLSTGDVSDPWSPAPGSIARVQAKAFAPGGRLISTQNRDGSGGGTASLTEGHLGRGALVQVQAEVRGVDERTDVVSVSDSVWLRPNLRVQQLTAPGRARAGDPTNIFAAVRETNGDVGNWATCTLYVDGVRVDWAAQVWVDAGDVVSCAFTHRFEQEGEHRVEVRVEPAPGAPRDDNPRDNAAGATVTVGPNRLSYSLWVNDLEQRDSVARTERWPGELYDQELRETWSYHLRSQNVFFSAGTPRTLQGAEIRIEVQERSGADVVFERVYTLPMEYAGGSWCGYGTGETGAARIYLCTGGWIGGTSLFYDRNAYRVVYHSRQYMIVWDKTTGEQWSYTYNDDQDAGTATPFTGHDFAMRFRLYDGDEVFAADPVAVLRHEEFTGDTPYQCTSYGTGEVCTQSWSRVISRTGSAESP